MMYEPRDREPEQPEVPEAPRAPGTERRVEMREVREVGRPTQAAPYERPTPPAYPRRPGMPGYPPEYREQAQAIAERRYTLARVTQIIWLVTGVLEGLIAIRFLLLLMAANPNAGFARFIYGITGVFLAPFAGLTATPTANGSVLEIPSLIAMIVYALLAWLVVRVIWILFDPPPRV